MVDTGTGLAVLGPSAIVLKILGPTADYVGDNLQQWTETRTQNLRRVFSKAEQKLGPERLEEPGQVPPRVLKGVLEEGQFCADELAAEYLGGVLASSRSDVERDDRGAALVALVSRLSSYQLRTHYIIYACAQQLLAGGNLEFGDGAARREMSFFLPKSTWVPAMEFSPAERADSLAIVDHILTGLARENLLHPTMIGTGHRSIEEGTNKKIPEPGLLVTLTLPGVELFTAAHGLSGRSGELFQGDSSTFEIEHSLPLGDGMTRIVDLPDSV